jgi:hypothetical protein
MKKWRKETKEEALREKDDIGNVERKKREWEKK